MSAALNPGMLALQAGQQAHLGQWKEPLTSGGKTFDGIVNRQPDTIPGEPMDRKGAPNFQASLNAAEIDVEVGAVDPMPAATATFRDANDQIYRAHRVVPQTLYYRYYCTSSSPV